MPHSHRVHGSMEASYATRSVFEPSRVFAPVSFFHPTTLYHPFHRIGLPPSFQTHLLEIGLAFKWTSRNNRKGRHELSITPEAHYLALDAPEPTAAPKQTLRGIKKMFTEFPVWDISYNIAILFVVGSAIFILNGVFLFLPYALPQKRLGSWSRYGGSITAVVGGFLFEVGAVLLLLEAVNEKKEDCFGWELKHAFTKGGKHDHFDSEKGPGWKLKPVKSCFHYHTNRQNLLGCDERGSTGIEEASSSSSGSSIERPKELKSDQDAWRWCPTWYELRHHYIYEIGFLGSAIQYIATTVFWISAFANLPGIWENMSDKLQFALYTVPQAIGCAGFIFSGLLFTLETQRDSYRPAPSTLGWHIGIWSFIGGVGFTLGAMLPFAAVEWAEEQAAITFIWASAAFFFASTIQWFESLDKHPVALETVG